MYNSMKVLPYIPYRIMEYLATSPKAENIWKMLAYNDYDALSKPNLTTTEKLNLIWRSGRQMDYGVFLTNLVEDVIPESKCIMKCYDYYIHANEVYHGTVVYAFDFLFGGTMSLVEYDGIPVSRWDLFVHELLDTLNGAYVGGIGTMTFLDNQSRYNHGQSVIGNSKTFTGGQIFLSVMVGDGGMEDGCE